MASHSVHRRVTSSVVGRKRDDDRKYTSTFAKRRRRTEQHGPTYERNILNACAVRIHTTTTNRFLFTSSLHAMRRICAARRFQQFPLYYTRYYYWVRVHHRARRVFGTHAHLRIYARARPCTYGAHIERCVYAYTRSAAAAPGHAPGLSLSLSLSGGFGVYVVCA